MSAIDFSCRFCGAECDCAPDPPARAICSKCCEDEDAGGEGHDYEYTPNVGRKTCVYCCQEAPLDWDED